MQKGLTLIELLVVVAIIGILSSVLFLGRTNEERKLTLQMTAYTLMQDLREMQEGAMGATEAQCNGDTSHTFGAYFHPVASPESYLLFADCNGNQKRDASDKLLREPLLEEGVKICSLSPSPLSIVFQPPEPTTYINGSDAGDEALVVLCLKSDETEQRTIKVNTVGRIEIE